MNDRSMFWVEICKLVIIGSVLIAFSVSGCTIHQDYRVSQAIDKGVDPILARTAYEKNGGQFERIIYLSSKNELKSRPIK